MTGPLHVGLAQLSLVNTAPPQLVHIAAAAGFDFIGARVRPVTASERVYDLQPGSALFDDTMRAIAETGVGIKDIEFLLLDGTDQRAAWLSMMKAGQALGASTLTVAASLTDHYQLADILGQMVQDGADYGITPTLEVISYQSVRSLPVAARLATDTGCEIVADALHLSRVGSTDEELRECSGLISILQLCDGPSASPEDREGLVREARSERGVPGEGELRLAEMMAALPVDTPLSVEAPSESMLARLGEQGWADRLREGAEKIITKANAVRAASLPPSQPHEVS